jgi:hypothetical protein
VKPSRVAQGTARRRGSTTDSARSDLTSTSSCALTSESNVRLWIQYVRKLRLARCVCKCVCACAPALLCVCVCVLAREEMKCGCVGVKCARVTP